MTFRLAGVVSVVGFLFFQSTSQAQFVPKNHLRAPMGFLKNSNGITEEKFNRIIDTITNLWAPIARQHGEKLVAERKWRDDEVDAYADQSVDGVWKVVFTGGLARRPEMTPDGLALAVCHELGHHFAGYYFKYGNEAGAAAEGEADYWATHVCLPRVWSTRGDETLTIAKRFIFNLDEKSQTQRTSLVRDDEVLAKRGCDTIWKTPQEKSICYRTLLAGLAVTKLFYTIQKEQSMLTRVRGLAVQDDGPPSLYRKDRTAVSETDVEHPDSQCRLDTYAQGAICKRPGTLREIPGYKNPKGQNSPSSELEAAKYSCMKINGDRSGNRPSCWFKPLLEKTSTSARLSLR